MDPAGREELDEPEARLKNSAVRLAIGVGLASREVPAEGRLVPSRLASESWARSGEPVADREAEAAPEGDSSGDRQDSVAEDLAPRAWMVSPGPNLEGQAMRTRPCPARAGSPQV